ncbi:MAG: hypothetical protein QOF67_1966 [Mycobacterium sp.]|nr:hypothetical protein [Mycobacterium sp.]
MSNVHGGDHRHTRLRSSRPPTPYRGNSGDDQNRRRRVSAFGALENRRELGADAARSRAAIPLPDRKYRGQNAIEVALAIHCVAARGQRRPAGRSGLCCRARRDELPPRHRRSTGQCRTLVRSGVVTHIPATRRRSSEASRSLRVRIPRGGRAFGQIKSTGTSSVIHRAPCIAEAARPAITPRRRVHSHAAAVRCASVGETPTGT